MKKILLSVFLCSSLACVAQDESITIEKDLEKLFNIGIKVAQDSGVQKAVVQLHQAYLHLLEVVLQKIASEFGPEENALAQVGLNYLAELAKDPAWRSIVSTGNPDDINDEMKKELQEIIAVVQTYGPILQKIMQEKVTVTDTVTNEDGSTCITTQLNPEYANLCLYFTLDRIIEALELAQKSVQ